MGGPPISDQVRNAASSLQSPPPLSTRIRREYDREASGYDRRWARYTRDSLGLLRPHLAGCDAGDLLDLGSGTGALLPLLAEWRARIGRYVGVDPSPEMLRIALSRRSSSLSLSVAFAAAEAERLPLRDASLDTVVSASSLHYWLDPARGLAEARRVLRPGGRLLLVDWCRDFGSMRLMNALMRVRRIRYQRMYGRAELAALLSSAGFRVASEERRKIGRVWGLMVLEATAV